MSNKHLEDYPELDKWLDDITQSDDETWCARADVEQKLLEMQEQIDKLKMAIKNSVKERFEEADYFHFECCNFCNENLTKGGHSEDCILKELTE